MFKWVGRLFRRKRRASYLDLKPAPRYSGTTNPTKKREESDKSSAYDGIMAASLYAPDDYGKPSTDYSTPSYSPPSHSESYGGYGGGSSDGGGASSSWSSSCDSGSSSSSGGDSGSSSGGCD